MKIAVLAHLKFPIAQPYAGGLERHTHGLVAGLQRRGHAVSLYAAEGSDPALSPISMCEPTGPHGDDPAHNARLDRIEEDAYARMMEAVAAGGYDIVHLNCLHDRPLRDGGRIEAPMLSVLHVPRYEPFARSLTAAPRIRVIAVSSQLAEIWRGVSCRIGIVPNGIDLKVFAPPPESPSGKPFAFWSGRLSREKGLHLAIDAARLAGIDLVFAGPRWDDPYWHDEIVPRLGPGVRDLGHLHEGALIEQLGRAAVAVVSPIWEEPFGLVVPEALACGAPIAAFSRGAVPDIIDETCGVLAKPDEVADLARAIREAQTLDRAACRARAERYGIEPMLDAYEAIYREMIAARRALENWSG